VAIPVILALANVAGPVPIVPVTNALPEAVISVVDVLPVTVKLLLIVTFDGKPITIVSKFAAVTTSTSLAVPETVNVFPPEITVEVEPSVNVKPVSATESTYALVAAS